MKKYDDLIYILFITVNYIGTVEDEMILPQFFFCNIGVEMGEKIRYN